ncbi:hypothetical protein FQR65_LT09346 [Abscondita terminalis]|nr:hypothetical protein FQR65_LT09346 [Abscondita terminalis]
MIRRMKQPIEYCLEISQKNSKTIEILFIHSVNSSAEDNSSRGNMTVIQEIYTMVSMPFSIDK